MSGKGSSFRENFKKIREQARPGVKLWEDARFILADVPLDRGEVKKILPLGLTPEEPAIATVFIADYPKTSFTVPYKEAALLVHVKTLLGSGLHCPWMIVDDDTGLIYGRELLGYPKKFGKFTFDENNGKVTASVTRRGVEVLKMEAELRKKEESPAPVFDIKTFNVGGLGQFFMFQPIWMFRAKEEITESHSAKVKVEFNESEHDPIAALVSDTGAPINGRSVVMDILGSRYFMPVGIAGIRWFINNYAMRYR